MKEAPIITEERVKQIVSQSVSAERERCIAIAKSHDRGWGRFYDHIEQARHDGYNQAAKDIAEALR